ncbi:MAG: septation regulator SpoVG [Bacillota bacterium]
MDLNITDVRVRLVKKDESKLKAVASITIDDCFVVHDIKIIQGTEHPFIAMPSRKTQEGEYKDVAHPISTSTRDMLSKIVLEEYQKALLVEA